MKSSLAKLVATSSCLVGFAAHLQAQSLIDNTHWTPVFVEEFTTSLKGLSSRWKIANGPPSGASKWYTPVDDINNIRIDTVSGYAYFYTKRLATPVFANGNRYMYSGANILSLFDELPTCKGINDVGYLYGMYEIRCKLPMRQGQYTAFWLHSGTAWPPEIDVYEHNGTSHECFITNAHYGSNENPQQEGSTNCYPLDLTDDFHTWTLVWTPAKMTWFFDGKELRTDSTASHVPGASSPNMDERCHYMKMILQTGSGLNYPDSTKQLSFDPFVVDYIRVYKPATYQPYSGNGGADFNEWYHTQEILYEKTPYKLPSE